MKKYLAKMLRRYAQKLDPQPAWPLMRVIEPHTTSTNGQSLTLTVLR
jgi:hypothetical protein